VPNTKKPAVQQTKSQQQHHNQVQIQKQQEAKTTSAATRKALRKQQPTSRTLRSQNTMTRHQLRPRRQKRHIAAAIALAGILTNKIQSVLSPPNTATPRHFCNAINPDTGREAEFQELRRCSEGAEWNVCNSDEFGRLAQGNDAHPDSGTNTIFFINRNQVPSHKKATYLRICAEDRPHKAIKKRIRHTVGGNRIEYYGDVSTKTSGLTTAKCLFNSVVSTPGAEFMCADIKDFYLNTPMKEFEYMRIRIDDIPAEIIARYNLEPLSRQIGE